MQPILPAIPAHAEADLRAFEAVCDRLGGFDGRLDPEFVDGFLTAAAAGPLARALPEVLALLPGDAFERAFGDPAAVAEALAALQPREAVIRRQLDPEALLDAPDTLRLTPWLADWSEEDRQRLVAEGRATAAEAAELQLGLAWARGALHAVAALEADWRPPRDADEEPLTAALDVLQLLATPPGTPAHAELLAATGLPADLPRDGVDGLVDAALFAVQDIRLWWVDHAPRPAPRRVEKAPGRNEPCPCGSGRKFKACHGR